MKRTIVTTEGPRLTFSDGTFFEYFHRADCCEINYADFEQVDDIARDYVFEGDILLEYAPGGFRFGDSRMMFYVPCYSEQNGYYTTDLTVVWRDQSGEVLVSIDTDCDMIYCC